MFMAVVKEFVAVVKEFVAFVWNEAAVGERKRNKHFK